jgi:hypothetical protein
MAEPKGIAPDDAVRAYKETGSSVVAGRALGCRSINVLHYVHRAGQPVRQSTSGSCRHILRDGVLLRVRVPWGSGLHTIGPRPE